MPPAEPRRDDDDDRIDGDDDDDDSGIDDGMDGDGDAPPAAPEPPDSRRHAYVMANYQVLLVRYGTRTATRSDVYLNYHLYGEPDGPIGMDYFFWIARNAERTVLVDTGFSKAGGARRERTELLDPASTYRALGVAPEQSPTVIVTHAHYDHIGNLDLFPSSTIVMSKNEYRFWRQPIASELQFHHSVEDDELEHLAGADAQGRVSLFSGSHQVAPGIEVIEVGGHTPGLSVVTIDTSDGVVLLASDAVHYYEEYERAMPFMSVSNLVDMYAGFSRIREWVGSGRVHHLVSGHDPDTLGRFAPLDGPLHDHVATIGSPA